MKFALCIGQLEIVDTFGLKDVNIEVEYTPEELSALLATYSELVPLLMTAMQNKQVDTFIVGLND